MPRYYIEEHLFKPASWPAPAKGTRFNLKEDMDTLTDVVDPYGSYLYRNRQG